MVLERLEFMKYRQKLAISKSVYSSLKGHAVVP